jgi:hypothetical protein
VTGDQTHPPAEPRFKPMTLALAGVAVLAAGINLLPPTYRPWNLSALGALGLFAAARLGLWPAILFTALGLGLKDLGFYLTRGWEPQLLSWLAFVGYVGLGWAFLRRTESPLKIGGAALSAGLVFFLVTNFMAWVEQADPYGYSLEGLLNCYVAGIPFHRGTLVGDVVFTAALFGAHAVLSRAYFPAERVVPQPEAAQ